MTLSYEFFSQVVRNAYTEDQVSAMQQYGYDTGTIEANARIKMQLPPEPPVSAHFQDFAPCRGPVNNHVNMTASYQPNFTNNVGNSQVLYQTYVLPGSDSHLRQQQQQQSPQCYQSPWQTWPSFIPGLGGQFPNQQQPPAAFEQHGFAEMWSIDPRLWVNHEGQSKGMTGVEQSLQFTPQADAKPPSDSCLQGYNDRFTAPQNATNQVESQSSSSSVHMNESNSPPEADPPVMLDDFISNSVLDTLPETGWGDDLLSFWIRMRSHSSLRSQNSGLLLLCISVPATITNHTATKSVIVSTMPLIPSDPRYIAIVVNPIAYVRAQQYSNPPTLHDINSQPSPIREFSRPISRPPTVYFTESPMMPLNGRLLSYDEPQTISPTALLGVSPATDNSIYSVQIRRNQRAQIAFQMMAQEQQRVVAAEQQIIMETYARIAEHTRRMSARLRQELQNIRFQEVVREAFRTYIPQPYAEYFTRVSNEQMTHQAIGTEPTDRTLTPEPEIEEPEEEQTQETQKYQQTSARSFNVAADQTDDDLEIIDIASQVSEIEDPLRVNTEDEVVYRGRQNQTDSLISPTLQRPEQETLANRLRGYTLPVQTTSIQEPTNRAFGKSKKRSFKIFDEYDLSTYTRGSLKLRKRQHID